MSPIIWKQYKHISNHIGDNITNKPVHSFLFQIPEARCVVEFTIFQILGRSCSACIILYNTHSGGWGNPKNQSYDYFCSETCDSKCDKHRI